MESILMLVLVLSLFVFTTKGICIDPTTCEPSNNSCPFKRLLRNHVQQKSLFDLSSLVLTDGEGAIKEYFRCREMQNMDCSASSQKKERAAVKLAKQVLYSQPPSNCIFSKASSGSVVSPLTVILLVSWATL